MDSGNLSDSMVLHEDCSSSRLLAQNQTSLATNFGARRETETDRVSITDRNLERGDCGRPAVHCLSATLTIMITRYDRTVKVISCSAIGSDVAWSRS